MARRHSRGLTFSRALEHRRRCKVTDCRCRKGVVIYACADSDWDEVAGCVGLLDLFLFAMEAPGGF